MAFETGEDRGGIGGYILIVEDSFVQSEILAALLEENGYRVEKAENGRIALEKSKQEQPVLVISDVLMPEMNGFELTRQIREDPALASIPVLLLTSLTETGDVAHALSCGADIYVTKPYEDSYLLKKIRELLEKKNYQKKPKEVSSPFKFTYEGEDYEIDTDREGILAFLLTTYEITIDRNQSLIRVQNELRELNDHLEQRVEERTKDLRRSHEELQSSYEQLASAEEKLRQQYCLLEQQESCIRENETLLNDVGKIVRVGGWELDIETELVRWTRETYRIHEVPEDVNYYLSQALLFYDQSDRKILESAIQRCMEEQEPYDLNLRFTSAKGRHLWTRAKGHAVTAGNKVVKIIGTLQDITDTKRIEDEITFKNIILLTQQETSLDSILIIDEHDRVISHNQRFIDLWGIPDNVIASREYAQVILSIQNKLEKPGEFIAYIKYQNEHPDEKSRKELSLVDGRVLDRFSAPMYGEDGRYVGRVCYFRDVTEQKQAEQDIRILNQDLERRVEERTNELQRVNEELRAINEELTATEEELRVQVEVTNEAYTALEKSDEQFRRLYESDLIGIAFADIEKILDANDTFLTIIGYTHEDLENGAIIWDKDAPPEWAVSDTKEFEELQTRGCCTPFEKEYCRKDGSRVSVLIGAALLEKNPLSWVSFIQDITERKKMSEQIRSSLAEKETLLREIHHRVKNNLQIIISLLNLQIRRIDDPNTIETLKDCQNRVRSMALIHEHLYKGNDISQIDLGNYVKSLGTVLFQSYEDGRRGIRFDISIRDIYVDINIAIPLGLISNELIINSLKYAFPDRHDGILSITASEDSDALIYIVEDNGRGIPEGITLENQNSMGLRLINMFTDQLNATVEVDRKAGTRFTFTIPKPRDPGPMDGD